MSAQQKPDPRKPDIELFDTQELIDELRRRSSVFFCCRRPLTDGNGETQLSSGKHGNMAWGYYWGVDGGRVDTAEALARTLGLIEITREDMLHSGNEDTR